MHLQGNIVGRSLFWYVEHNMYITIYGISMYYILKPMSLNRICPLLCLLNILDPYFGSWHVPNFISSNDSHFNHIFIACVRNPRNREDGHQRIANQSHKQLKQRKERENTRFNEVQQFDYVLGARERVLIESINYRLQVTNIEDNTPLYIAKETTKKRKSKTPNSDQKRIQNQILKRGRCNWISRLGTLITSISRLGICPSRLICSETDFLTFCLYH